MTGCRCLRQEKTMSVNPTFIDCGLTWGVISWSLQTLIKSNARCIELNILCCMSKKNKQQRINIHLFVLLPSRRDDGEKTKRTGEVGFSLIWDISTKYLRFWTQRNWLRFCWLWKIIKISQHWLKNRGGCRKKVSFSALVENGMVEVFLEIQLFSCENL